MKMRSLWLIRLVALLAAYGIRILLSLVRYHVKVNGQRVHPNDPHLDGRFIYAIFHETSLFLAGGRTRSKFCVLASQSADGELIAETVRWLGHTTARGSSTRGGAQGLQEMMAAAQDRHIIVTVDGPRGPRRYVKPGVVYLASRTGLPIVPVGVDFNLCWRARSWDRFAVPWPYSDAYAYVSPLLHVPPGLNKEGIEHYRQLLQCRMEAAMQSAEDWAARRIRIDEEPYVPPDEKRRAA
jgi:hypothetical protein